MRALTAGTLLALLLAAGCGGSNDAAAPPLPQGGEPVELDPADFVDGIDNPWWPMTPGSKWVYTETDEEGTEQRIEVEVLEERKEILGISATVVHDLVTEDGVPVEDTYDWYAQDRWGNVWYLGEDTTEFEDGKPVGNAGAWEAGVDGAYAGVVVPADPEVGMSYRQEHYAGEAEDRGEILSLDETAATPFGSWDGVLMTEDTTPLEPDVVERKYYVRDIGPVLAVQVSGGSSREELVEFTRGR